LPALGRAGLVCQTTITDDTFGEVAKVILQKSREVKVFNTTCRSTRDTQHEAASMAAQADLMLVLGSRKSANTRHLVEVCRAAGAETMLVEEASEVSEELLAGWCCVGIVGGASCPKELIQEVEERVRELSGAELPRLETSATARWG
jgi:4-hydroxy-3-methylbut-2-enyl diphosphate reductase